MKITWLGQAGLLFETNTVKIMIDPYLSDSVERINPKNFRRVPVKKELFDLDIDVLIFTHNHLDHYDPETANRFLAAGKNIICLSPKSVWQNLDRSTDNNFVQFDRHTEWTFGEIRFTAVKAVHSDDFAIGVVIEYRDKKYYVTGDTLYNSEIFMDLPENINTLFLPINGVGNIMNEADAFRFAQQTGANHAVPLHFGMFDEKKPSLFQIVPNVYEKIKLDGELL